MSQTHHPKMLLPWIQGNRYISVSPAVFSDFITLEKLAKLLDAAAINKHDPVRCVAVTVLPYRYQQSLRSLTFLFPAVSFPRIRFSSSFPLFSHLYDLLSKLQQCYQLSMKAVTFMKFLQKISTHLTRAFTANLTTVESRKRGVTRMWNNANAAKASEGLGLVS